MPDLNSGHPLGQQAAQEGQVAAQAAQLQAFVTANYPALFKRLHALGVLLVGMPIEQLLAAAKSQQATAMFTMSQAPAEEVARYRTMLANDQKLIEAALNLQRVATALGLGQ